MNLDFILVQQPDVLQIDKYYDLYNSLVVYSTRKWGCSGEHITGMLPTTV